MIDATTDARKEARANHQYLERLARPEKPAYCVKTARTASGSLMEGAAPAGPAYVGAGP
jgi:hypothetical protein